MYVHNMYNESQIQKKIEMNAIPLDTRLQHTVYSSLVLQRGIAIIPCFLAFLHPREAAGLSVFVRIFPRNHVKLKLITPTTCDLVIFSIQVPLVGNGQLSMI